MLLAQLSVSFLWFENTPERWQWGGLKFGTVCQWPLIWFKFSFPSSCLCFPLNQFPPNDTCRSCTLSLTIGSTAGEDSRSLGPRLLSHLTTDAVAWACSWLLSVIALVHAIFQPVGNHDEWHGLASQCIRVFDFIAAHGPLFLAHLIRWVAHPISWAFLTAILQIPTGFH